MNTKRNPVGWFEIYVGDMERAKAFYEKTFDQSLERIPSPQLEMWAFPGECDGGGAAGALCKMEGKEAGVGGVIIYFSCEDCAITSRKAIAAGGTMQLEKMNIGDYGFISLVLDTEGNMIGLHSMN
ncbi:VOC family protein [Luteolibacter algae]|uniref:VOC family protein n=1 Tax=Luteolibacter algae TaxID=454151 RepID=A0ABW5D3J9_9BACT